MDSTTNPIRNSQASITLALSTLHSNYPLKLHIPHLSIDIHSSPTIAAPPTRPRANGLHQPNSNSIAFPSNQSFSSSPASRSFSDASSSSATPSLLHSATAPLPALRHPSASLFELLDDQHHPTTRRTHLTRPQLHASSIWQPSSSHLLSSKSPNSIQFPSTSPTATTFTFVSTPPLNGPDSLDWFIQHWLTSTFAPDPINSEADRAPVLELDLLVGFKSISDQLNLPPLDRDQAWDALQHVFPTAQPWARPTPAGMRSDKELVVAGIKLKSRQEQQDGGSPTKDFTRPPPGTLLPETHSPGQISQPFRQLDFSKPIPDEIHSKELVEYMRKRICALELQSQLQGTKTSSNRRKLLKHANPGQLGHQMKKVYNPSPRLFRFDHHLPSSFGGTTEKDRVRILGERIWLSLIKVCKHTKDNFLNGERLTASWMEHMNKFEFDLIVKHSKSNQNRTMETSSKKVVRIVYPFQKSTAVKLFKSQPVAEFNSLVFSHDRRPNALVHDNLNRRTSDDSILKNLSITQILPYELNREVIEPEQDNFFTTISKRNLPKLSNNRKGDETRTVGRNNQKPRGKSLDMLTNPTRDLLIKEQERDSKEGSSIGVMFETFNQNFRAQRKSLNLDKLFSNYQVNDHNICQPALESPPTPMHSILIVQEILVEFNLAFLNQLTFQVKLFKQEPSS